MSVFRRRPAFFRSARFNAFTAPRRPRHPFLRIVLGVVGVGLLLALLFLGLFVGVAMLATGLLWRLWHQRGKPIARARANNIDGQPLEGTFRVVGKAQLPLAR